MNIRAIINHFNIKIETFSSLNETQALTEEQVLEIIKNNYDSLTLKLQDGLDVYEIYNPEKVKESLYFTNLMNTIIVDYRSSDGECNLNEQQTLPETLSVT